ncbi:MAG: lysozyme [Rickettsiales bacterium]|nr:lysozyme [Rickettsiales bacterium]
MRAITPKGIALIREFEGFAPTPYICAGGYPTIGYGHVIRPHENFDEPITQHQAESLLRHDVRHAQASVLRLIHVPLSDGQYDALVSFTYNLGGGALQRSTLRRTVNAQNHAQVPEQLMRWVYAGGRKLRGLVRRRQAESLRYSA